MDMSDPLAFPAADEAPRPAFPAILRGFTKRCPACGTGSIFGRFLKVADNCGHCGETLSHHRADDAPPYFTIMIVGHIVVPMMLWLELAYLPPVWIHAALWPALTLALSLWFLPRLKGAVVGWQWSLRMHGFGGETDD
jgi:uncharacterized protein (DUF983 family)